MLTAARRQALSVLVTHGRGRYSGETDPARRLVHWRPTDWLIDNGYARRRPHTHAIEPTDAGRELAAQEGLLEGGREGAG